VALSAGGEGGAAAGSGDLLDKCINAFSASVLNAGCTRRSRVLRGIHLRVWVGESGAGEGRMAAAHGYGALAWNWACGKAWGRGKSGWRESSPQRGASGALSQRQGAAARRVAEARWQWRRRRLGLHEPEAAAAGLTALGHGGGTLNRAAAALACGPGAPCGGCPCQTWVRVRAGLVPEVGDDPDGWAPPISERRGKRRGRVARWTGLGEEGVGPRGGEGKKKRLGQLDRAGGEGKEELGRAARKKREREKEKREWVRPN
jgi:hypothetical protein